MALLISFDIDGTLEVGDPPGIVTLDMVRRAKAMGCLIGSCSDRPVGNQKEIWERSEIAVDFTILKHQLDLLRSQFEAEQYFHLGDTFMDRYFASLAGFEFIDVTDTSGDLWAPFAPYQGLTPWANGARPLGR